MKYDQKILKFDITQFPFNSIVKKYLEIEDLEQLHSTYSQNDKIRGIGEDTKTDAHKKFYQYLNIENNELILMYYKFIKTVLFENFDNKILFQRSPSLRISYPNNLAVSTWHADGDNINKHPPGEINIFLPLTNCFGNNSIWIESIPGKQDFHPVKLKFGEILIFNGNECVHGNKINDTNITRLSFDFRILPRDKYNKDYPHRTSTKNLSYTIGEYYIDSSFI